MSTETFNFTITRENEFAEDVELVVEVTVEDKYEDGTDLEFDAKATVLTRDGESMVEECWQCNGTGTISAMAAMLMAMMPPYSPPNHCPPCKGTGKRTKTITLSDYELSDAEKHYRDGLADRRAAQAEKRDELRAARE